MPGVTSGAIRPELRDIGVVRHVDGRNLDASSGDLDVTAGWGYAGRGGICMPGSGKVVERQATASTAEGGCATPAQQEALGQTTLDVYLNDEVCWQNIPRAVWDYTIGGYQVIKKWLSYREKRLLDRGLKPEEARYVAEMARRIAAILLMGPELDANYEAVKADTYPWPQT